MKQAIVGLVLVLVGIAVGLGVGIGWGFIGGLVLIIHQLQASHVSAFLLAFGIARMVFSGLIGWIAALIFVFPGWAFISTSDL